MKLLLKPQSVEPAAVCVGRGRPCGSEGRVGCVGGVGGDLGVEWQRVEWCSACPVRKQLGVVAAWCAC